MAALVNALKMTYVNIGTVRPARESISRAPEVQPLVSPEFLKNLGITLRLQNQKAKMQEKAQTGEQYGTYG